MTTLAALLATPFVALIIVAIAVAVIGFKSMTADAEGRAHAINVITALTEFVRSLWRR